MTKITFLRLLVPLCIVIATGVTSYPTAKQDKKYFSLEDLIPANPTFSQRGFNGTWLSEFEILYRTSEGYNIFNLIDGASEIFITKEILDYLNTTDITISPNRSNILARSDPETGFRYSSAARYAIYDIAENITHQIAGHQRLQYCTYTGKDSAIAFVLNNNIFVRKGYYDGNSQITTDGIPGVIYNGVPDWVYEEEVFGSGSAMWFSPDKSKIAFASFNDTLVDEVVYVTYGMPGSIEDQYPKMWPLKYPKVGRTNPTVSLKVKNLENLSVSELKLEAPLDEVSEDHILGTVTWASNSEVVAMWLNRRQNRSVLVSCKTDTGLCKKEVLRSEPDGWIDVTTPLFSQDNGSNFIDIIPLTVNEGSNNQWFHVAEYIRQPGGETSEPKGVSRGEKTVISIVGWNQNLGTIYYMSTLEGLPWEKHLFVGGARTGCLSCSKLLPGGVPCTYASASAPPGVTYYALTCQAGDAPSVTTIFDAETDSPISVWQDNAALRDTLQEYWHPQLRYMMLAVAGHNATVKLYLPPELNTANPDSKRYPMIVNIYAGPNSARVTDNFGLGYQTYMPTNRSVIYAHVEGRGSGLKGKNSLFAINNKLGTYEIDDIIDITSKLTALFPWIDSSRVGIWGWSYGGYAAGMVLTKDWWQVFRCGVSVAPVTSWLYYDSIYTERYMGLPTKEDNLEGYIDGDMTRRARLMRDHHWLLLHGNADDNVHYQNAMAMAKMLQELDLPFEQMSYPDEAHGLVGVSRHVYHTIDDFWTRCFTPSNSTSFSFG